MIIIVSDSNKNMVQIITENMKREYINSEIVTCEDRIMAVKKTIFMNADILVCRKYSPRMTHNQLEVILRNNIPKTRICYIEDLMEKQQKGALAV